MAGPTGPAEPDLRFFGTERRDGTAAALVTFPATNKVGGWYLATWSARWRVLSVDSNRLVLGQGDEQRTFEIFGAGARGTGPKPVPPSGRPKRNGMGQNGLPTSPPTFRPVAPTYRPVAPRGVTSPKGIPAPRNATVRPTRPARTRACRQTTSASPDKSAVAGRCIGPGDAAEPDGTDTPDDAAPPDPGSDQQ